MSGYFFLGLLALARVAAFLSTFPVFEALRAERAIMAPLTFGLAAFALPMVTPNQIGGEGFQFGLTFVAVLTAEVVIGAMLGVIFGMPIKIVQSMGQFLDNQRGAPIDSGMSPIQREPVSPIESVLTPLTLLAFFGFELHHDVFRAVYASYRALPPGGAAPLSPEALPILLRPLQLYHYLLFKILPVLVVCMTIDLTAGFVGRRINGFDASSFSNSLKTGIILLFVTLLGNLLLSGEHLPTLTDALSPMIPSLADLAAIANATKP